MIHRATYVTEMWSSSFFTQYQKPWICCCSVTKSYPALCNPLGCSMPAFPVYHQLLQFAQTHVHWVGDMIQPSHPLSSPFPAFNLAQYQGLFQWVGSSHQVASVLELNVGASGKETAAKVRDVKDPGLIPGSGRSPGVGNGNPLHHSCLENPVDRGAQWLQSVGSQRVGHNWSNFTHATYTHSGHLIVFSIAAVNQ